VGNVSEDVVGTAGQVLIPAGVQSGRPRIL
jgi:hypothetical protein